MQQEKDVIVTVVVFPCLNYTGRQGSNVNASRLKSYLLIMKYNIIPPEIQTYTVLVGQRAKIDSECLRKSETEFILSPFSILTLYTLV